jgi:WhiB family redox-sensing transcriptional regulator
VRTECLADALDYRIEFGVWGGMTERERRALLRRRPDVISWRELLEHARAEYERQPDGELIADGYEPQSTDEPVADERPGPQSERWSPVARLWSSVTQRMAGSATTAVNHDRRDLVTSAEYDRRKLMEVEVRQCCETGVKPLIIFFTLAGLSYPEATVEAQRALSEAYLRDRSDHVSPLWLRQIAEERLQSWCPLPTEQVPAASPAFSACVSIASRHVLELLAALPKPQRQALAWAAGGCSPAEIAASRGCALPAVLADLQHGRDALKHALGGTQHEWAVDDDEPGDGDLDEILMAVVDELADTIAPADITAATKAIMAEIAPASSLLGLRRSGDHRALG